MSRRTLLGAVHLLSLRKRTVLWRGGGGAATGSALLCWTPRLPVSSHPRAPCPSLRIKQEHPPRWGGQQTQHVSPAGAPPGPFYSAISLRPWACRSVRRTTQLPLSVLLRCAHGCSQQLSSPHRCLAPENGLPQGRTTRSLAGPDGVILRHLHFSGQPWVGNPSLRSPEKGCKKLQMSRMGLTHGPRAFRPCGECVTPRTSRHGALFSGTHCESKRFPLHHWTWCHCSRGDEDPASHSDTPFSFSTKGWGSSTLQHSRQGALRVPRDGAAGMGAEMAAFFESSVLRVKQESSQIPLESLWAECWPSSKNQHLQSTSCRWGV